MTIGLVSNDANGVSIYTANETSGTVVVCVEVVSGSIASGLFVTVNLSTADSSAICT